MITYKTGSIDNYNLYEGRCRISDKHRRRLQIHYKPLQNTLRNKVREHCQLEYRW